MPAITMRTLFATPKKRGRPTKGKKSRMCAPKVSYNDCLSAAKKAHCTYVHGKREYCRTRKNKKRS